MPDLNEFFNSKSQEEKEKPYHLEKLGGVRPCAKCKDDVNGALWDPVEYTMTWKCKNGHDNSFKVN
jgi:hypothetical protein